MKRLFLGLMMFFVGVTIPCFAYAMQLPSVYVNTVNNVSFETTTNVNDRELQKLFKELCQKMGVHSDKVRLELDNKLSSRVCATSNTVIIGEEIKKLPKDQLEFAIAHELAHIKNSHLRDLKNQKVVKETCTYLGFWTGLTAATSFLGFNMVKNRLKTNTGKVAVSIVAVTFSMFVWSKVIGLIGGSDCFKVIQSSKKEEEKHADLMAIAALKSKRGAVDYFRGCCERNKEHRTSCIKKGDISGAQKFDELGNYLLGDDHPLFTERIAYCDAASL
jgi:hypothetical protein